MMAPKVKYNSCNCCSKSLNENDNFPEFKFSKPEIKKNLVISFYKRPEKQKNKSLF